MQDSVIALAIYGKEPDRLTPEQRASLPFPHRMARALGTFTGDAPVYLAGGVAGGMAAGPIGAGAGAMGLREGLRSVYLDQIRKGEVKDAADFMERCEDALLSTAEGALTGMGLVAGGMAGATGAARLGLGKTAQAGGAYLGQLAGMNAVTVALREEMPSAQEFMDSAVLILGLNVGARLPGMARARVRALNDTLITINEKTDLRPEAVAEAAKKDPSVVGYLENPQKEIPESLIGEIEKAVIYNDSRSVKMVFTRTEVEASLRIERNYENILKIVMEKKSKH